jgi:hypothetical protein
MSEGDLAAAKSSFDGPLKTITFSGRTIRVCYTVDAAVANAWMDAHFPSLSCNVPTCDDAPMTVIGLDAEWKPRFHRTVAPPRPALVQVSDRDGNVLLIHVCHMKGAFPVRVSAALAHPRVLKVGVGCSMMPTRSTSSVGPLCAPASILWSRYCVILVRKRRCLVAACSNLQPTICPLATGRQSPSRWVQSPVPLCRVGHNVLSHCGPVVWCLCGVSPRFQDCCVSRLTFADVQLGKVPVVRESNPVCSVRCLGFGRYVRQNATAALDR